MIAEPAATPVTTPVALPTVATVIALLLQVPPALVFASAVVRPVHTVAVPVMAGGGGATVTTTVRLQPVANE